MSGNGPGMSWKMSSPPSPKIRSLAWLSNPPVSTSLSGPPKMNSSPEPPDRMSRPGPPRMTSRRRMRIVLDRSRIGRLASSTDAARLFPTAAAISYLAAFVPSTLRKYCPAARPVRLIVPVASEFSLDPSGLTSWNVKSASAAGAMGAS